MQIIDSSAVSTPDITEEEYFASPRTSNSHLRLLKYSPSYYKKVTDGDEEGISSSGFLLGSMVDCKVLTPHLFDDRYRLAPSDMVFPSDTSEMQQAFVQMLIDDEDKDLAEAYVEAGYSERGKTEEKAQKLYEGLDPYIAFMQDLRATGRQPYSVEDLEKVALIIQSISDHKRARRLLFEEPDHGLVLNQFIIFFEWGLKCRCMIDTVWIDDDAETVDIVDLKSTGKPLHSFSYWYGEYDYARQQAFYEEGVRRWLQEVGRGHYQLRSLIVVADTGRQHEVKVVEPPRTPLPNHPGLSIEEGRKEAAELLERLIWHKQHDLWKHSREYHQGDGIEPLVT